ncbi:glycosyltransferase family 9 protein [bacterium]|nr:glycosyltransferase family 9 protein [bacterium]
MTIELMRKVDYWIGVPLCFLLSGINYILRFTTYRKKGKKVPEKILFIKLSEMGSIILAYPLIKKAQKECPDAKIFFLTFDKNKFIFELLDIVPDKNILTIREKPFHLFVLDTIRVIRKMRNERIDITFDLELFSRFTAILTYLSKAEKRAGFFRYDFEGLYRGSLLTHNVGHNPLIHISKSFLSLWQAIMTEDKFNPELYAKIEDNEINLPRFDTQSADQIRNRLNTLGFNDEFKIFLVNPGEGRLPLREWPLENYIFLSKKLLENSRNCIIIAGMENESEKVDLFCNALNNKRCINLINKTSVAELLALFNMSEALITNDCGLAHLASLSSIKKFIFFGPESPQAYSPLGGNTWILYSNLPCSPCFSAFNHRKSSCRDNRCLKAIKLDETFNLIKSSCEY